MAVAGRVAIVPKGEWSANATYKRLDAVTHNNTLYFAKKEVPAGTATSNTEYWSKSIVGGAGGVATADEAGVVKPADGLAVAEDGTLKVNIDGTTLTMDQVNNVIKLADTLKEKINGAFPAANVVNNQITTETGYALDARQANPNLDGTLAKQLSDLNGSLSVKKYYGELTAKSDLAEFRSQLPMYNSIYIFGNMVMISFSVILKTNISNATMSDFYKIVTLPASLFGKIEWNNLCGSFANSRDCPFIFSDNGNDIILMLPGGAVSAGDELRVFGLGFLY